ncbi:SDR family oxidoreductase [Altererythrobacter luteolus]|uniref:SDR family oxidoreductase n=1 Tax=Pontixanthobacter luteolus TaxID=295089 RepID=A0A6I4V307_9SPHN|nr:glucose 1-dehydrogenase [Pontixanthobacter luteolus]MXP48273.1 SDR family oxidoreductase [Pontixanthobacter luteolus]
MTDNKRERVALVTGASSGIGRATARAFVRAGYAVALVDRDADQGKTACAELQADGGDCTFVICDVADESQVAAMVKKVITHFGRIDAAFNNAGIEGETAETDQTTTENWDRVMNVNLRGLWFCMREELYFMLKENEGGTIVNCASVAGLVGIPGIPAYVASKHGVVGLTKAAALEYAERNVRINAVCPGAIETPMLQRFMSSTEGGREQMVATEPMGRIGTPGEIADAVVWLCSSGASFMTGQAVAVDGGWTAK